MTRSICLILLAGLLFTGSADAQVTRRESISFANAQAGQNSGSPAISADGRYIAFESDATNLILGDLNGKTDVFVRDVVVGTTTRVSLDSAGAEADDRSFHPSISADGRYVAFNSLATNLVAGDGNGFLDVFVHDRATGQTVRASVSSAGVEGDGSSTDPAISGDGRLVAFHSNATVLAAGDGNGANDVFVRDLVAGTTTLISTNSSGVQGFSGSQNPEISGDGRWVCFYSLSSNLGGSDSNAAFDVFVKDLQTDQTTRVSVDSTGAQADGASSFAAISGDGRYVAFRSDASNLVAGDANGAVDIFVHDMQTGQTVRASVDSAGAEADGASDTPALSADGRSVVFYSFATTLVAGDTNGKSDVFLHDLVTGQTDRMSVDCSRVQGNGDSFTTSASVSGDGRYVVFQSVATNLVPGDTNSMSDVFLRDRQCPATAVYCTAKINSLGCSPSIAAAGTASMSAGSGFFITASNVINNKFGLFFYSTHGQQTVPFQGGYLCIKPPTKRTAVQPSQGNPPPNDCSGHFSMDFNIYLSQGADPGLAPGIEVDGQYWSRDPAASFSTSLSNAVHLTICP